MGLSYLPLFLTNRFGIKITPHNGKDGHYEKWKSTQIGLVALMLVMSLSIGVFADVRVVEPKRVISKDISSQSCINKDNRVKVITKKEYQDLKLDKDTGISPLKADINETVTLSGLTKLP